MPIVKTIQGDLIKMFKNGEFSAIAHGCNCYHTMGAGIAGQIAQEFPEVREADYQTSRGYNLKLGSFSKAATECGDVYNLYTQYRPGREDPVRLANSVVHAFIELNHHLKVQGWGAMHMLGIPLIGCGIAGGDWKYISTLIDKTTPSINVCVVEYQP